MSVHLVGSFGEDGTVASILRAASGFVRKGRDLVSASGAEPIVLVGIDTNTGLPSNYGNVVGNMTCPPFTGHTPDRQRQVASWFASLGVSALNTFSAPYHTNPTPTRVRSSQVSQIDFVGSSVVSSRSHWHVADSVPDSMSVSDHRPVFAAIVKENVAPRPLQKLTYSNND